MESGAGRGTGEVVCFEEFRRERERRSARVLPYLAPTERRAPVSPFGVSTLTSRELQHRQRMFDHLANGATGSN